MTFPHKEDLALTRVEPTTIKISTFPMVAFSLSGLFFVATVITVIIVFAQEKAIGHPIYKLSKKWHIKSTA